MTKRKNEYGALKTLLMFPAFKIVDCLTQASLQLKSCVEFNPGGYLPDFSEVQNTIRQEIDNKKMSVEAAAEKIIEIFNEYEPEKITVRIDIINNNSFFPVSVIAESGNEEGTDKKKNLLKNLLRKNRK